MPFRIWGSFYISFRSDSLWRITDRNVVLRGQFKGFF